MAQHLQNSETPPATYGPVADDLLAKLIKDAESTSLFETVPMPGAVLVTCIGPALRELEHYRSLHRGKPNLRTVPSPTPRPQDGGQA